MVTKVMWVSKNMPLARQIDELDRVFGEIQLTIENQSFRTADDIVRKFENYDEMVIGAPLSVINALNERGIKPLFAEMSIVQDNFDLEHNGRKYRFDKFVRIIDTQIKKEELIPKERR